MAIIFHSRHLSWVEMAFFSPCAPLTRRCREPVSREAVWCRHVDRGGAERSGNFWESEGESWLSDLLVPGPQVFLVLRCWEMVTWPCVCEMKGIMFIGLAEENTNILEELFITSSSEVEAEKARGLSMRNTSAGDRDSLCWSLWRERRGSVSDTDVTLSRTNSPKYSSDYISLEIRNFQLS